MAWFTFTDASNETFVIRLSNPEDISHARGLLAGTETSDPLIAGTVVKEHASYNIGWSYHLRDVFFFEISAEVGDSTMRYIEKHLAQVGGALLPGSLWTGWSSALVAELDPLHGGAGNNRLEGSNLADIIFGKAGDDAVLSFAGNDYLVGNAGRDTLVGGDGNDKLGGGADADTLRGGAGADILVGGHGADRDAGDDNDRDRIVYGSKSELMATDQIFQFDFKGSISEVLSDRIDLRSIDADRDRDGDQAFRFVDVFGTAGAGKADGQVRVVDQGEGKRIEIDFNGDNLADAYIVVRDVESLSQADFFL